jgi:hypothetical protein
MIALATSRKLWLRLIPDWLCGALFLAIPALYNSYPLVTSDSGAYISNGYELQVPLDRPLAYSVFVRVASMNISMWGVVLAQALIISFLLLIIAKHLLGASYRLATFAAIMLLIGVATSAGWFVSQIMPDIFTAALLLCCCILSVIRMPRAATWGMYIVMFCSVMIHNSNMLIALLLGIILIIYTWRRRADLLRRTAVALLIISAISWLALSSMNAIAGRGFRPSAASHVFIVCRMVENGIMEQFLEEHCPVDSPSYKLCAYKDKLPNRQWDFMWGDANSALYATGGWLANEEEYTRIIRKSLLSPKYLGLHIVKNTEATLRQLPLIDVGDGLGAYGYGSSPNGNVKLYRPEEYKEFNSSLQQLDELRFNWWNGLITAFALLTCITALLLKPRPATPAALMLPSLRRLLKLTLLFLLINAGITATFATVVGRYEARVFWILPFFAVLYIIRRLNTEDETITL